jgi:fucose 4-O-acetylase-like acetyltransferase
MLAAAAVIYPLVLPFWRQNYMPGGGASIHLLAGPKVLAGALGYESVKYVEGCVGSILACFVAYLLYKLLHATLLTWLGRYTLEIYVSHQFFVYMFHSPNSAAIVAAFLVALLASIGLAVILKRSPILDALLYGGHGVRTASPAST